MNLEGRENGRGRDAYWAVPKPPWCFDIRANNRRLSLIGPLDVTEYMADAETVSIVGAS